MAKIVEGSNSSGISEETLTPRETEIDMGPLSQRAGEEPPDPKAKQEDEIERRLTNNENKSEEAATIARLVADPDIRRVMEARQKGESIRIVSSDEAGPERDEGKRSELVEPVEEPEDLDILSNKELTKLIINKVANVTEQAVAARLEPLEASIADFGQKFASQEKSAVQQASDILKSKFGSLNDTDT